MTIINGIDTELTKPDLLVMQCLLRDANRNPEKKSSSTDSGYTSQASVDSSEEDDAAADIRDRSRASLR